MTLARIEALTSDTCRSLSKSDDYCSVYNQTGARLNGRGTSVLLNARQSKQRARQ